MYNTSNTCFIFLLLQLVPIPSWYLPSTSPARPDSSHPQSHVPQYQIYVSFKTFNAVIILYFFVWLFYCLMVISCVVWLFNMYLICYSKSPMRSSDSGLYPQDLVDALRYQTLHLYLLNELIFENQRELMSFPWNPYNETVTWHCYLSLSYARAEKNKAQSVLTECLLKIAWSYSRGAVAYSGYSTSNSVPKL